MESLTILLGIGTKNFIGLVNRRVDISENIKRYQDTLSYALSKVDYSVRENLSCYLVT